MRTARLAPDEADAIRAAFLDKVCVELFPPDLADPQRTLYFRILDELSRDVVEHALAQATMDARALAQVLQDIDTSVLNWVQSAGDEWGAMEVWRHKHDGAVALEDWNGERIEWLGRAITKYYGQPARSPLLDRVLADMFMALRVHAFAANLSQTCGSSGGKGARRGGSMGKLLFRIFTRSLLTALALTLLIVGTKWAIEADVVDPLWTAGPVMLVVVLTPLFSLLIIFNRLGNWALAQQHHHAAQLYLAASDAYNTLADDTVAVPTATLQTALDEATARGANWIGVDLVIDDLRRRGIAALPALSCET